ncbi:MAG: TadE/TadG family type IV pilus assembly protein [Acidimicrobiia bacterium]
MREPAAGIGAEGASAVVEFALVLPLVLVLLFGIVEVAVIARSEIQLIHAAREGAREAAASPDTSRAANAVRSALGDLGSRARIGVSRPAAIGARATVRVSVQHRVAAPIFGGFTVTLSASSTMRVER